MLHIIIAIPTSAVLKPAQAGLVFVVVVVGLWSQSADKLTIHSIPCNWILKADNSSKSTLPFAGLQHMQQWDSMI